MIQKVDDQSSIPSLDNTANQILYFNHNYPLQLNYITSFTFKYLFAGKLNYEIDGREVCLNQGNFILIKDRKSVATYINRPVQGVSFFFDAELASSFDDSVLEYPMPLVKSNLVQLLQGLQSDINSHRPINSVEFLKKMSQEIRLYSNSLNGWRKSIKYSKKSTSFAVLLKLMHGRKIMENRYAQPLDMTYLANEVAMSKFNFIRKFKEAFHITPQQFLLKKRILESQNLIRNTDLSVTEISLACGFNDIHHFSKTFKKHVGISPSNYKN